MRKRNKEGDGEEGEGEGEDKGGRAGGKGEVERRGVRGVRGEGWEKRERERSREMSGSNIV